LKLETWKLQLETLLDLGLGLKLETVAATHSKMGEDKLLKQLSSSYVG
jgi:hypothetical protein